MSYYWVALLVVVIIILLITSPALWPAGPARRARQIFSARNIKTETPPFNVLHLSFSQFLYLWRVTTDEFGLLYFPVKKVNSTILWTLWIILGEEMVSTHVLSCVIAIFSISLVFLHRIRLSLSFTLSSYLVVPARYVL